MSDKPKPTEAEINYAIEYALRCDPVDGKYDEDWNEYIELSASDLQPFTMRLLQALNVI